jgi:hypothetical protein
VTYEAADSAGNVGTLSLAVVVKVASAPEIRLLGEPSMRVEAGTDFRDPGAVIYDLVDGDLSQRVGTNASGLNTRVLGLAFVAYWMEGRDSQGLLATPVLRRVTVEDTQAPVCAGRGKNSKPEPAVVSRRNRC